MSFICNAVLLFISNAILSFIFNAVLLCLFHNEEEELVMFFGDNPSNHVWAVICSEGNIEQRCQKNVTIVHLFATTDDDIVGSETGLEALGLTNNIDDMTVYTDSSLPGKSKLFSQVNLD